MNDGVTIALSLIAHTNVGKTTLARTLLGNDVGEVRDAPHVTTVASRHLMIDTDQGDALVLWDTPGFSDSVRLARRLAAQANPVGWFLSQVWDRFRDRPLYLSQRAVRNVRDDADVVLYLVNAAEAPGDAGYLGAELEVLHWIGRPVIVLLNQTGPPRPHAEEAEEEGRWREAVGWRPFVHGVLALDAFARCWVQEIVLLRAIGPALAQHKRAAFARLVDAWQARRNAQFDASMAALAEPIVRAATDKVTLPNASVGQAVRAFVTGRPESEGRQRALSELTDRVSAAERASSERLLDIHGLEGRVTMEARERLIDALHTDAPVSEGKAAVMGGVLTGALTGLKADLAAGGLTLGAGTLLGALAGAAGGAGLVRGFNIARGQTETQVRWNHDMLDRMVSAALLRYLAVAHFGRGRGEWTATEVPTHWREAVERTLAARRAALTALWSQSTSAAPARFESDVRATLKEAARVLLDALYPGALDTPPGKHT